MIGPVDGRPSRGRWCRLVVGVVGVVGVAMWIGVAALPGVAAEPAAPAAAAEPRALAEPLTFTTLTVAQARQMVRDQEAKPRFPMEGGEAEIRAALGAVGARQEDVDRLLLHNDEFFQRKVYGLGMHTQFFKFKAGDLAKGELAERRLLLAHHDHYGMIANRFADFLHLALPEVPPDVAEVLGEFKGSLCLPRLQRLDSAPLARALARHKLLVLRAVTAIGAEAAAPLAEGDARIELPLLMSLDSEPLARKLASQPDLALPHLRTLGPGGAKGLAASRGTIALPELGTFTPEVARALAGCQGTIRLHRFTPTPEVADILARGEVKLVVGQIVGDHPVLLKKLLAGQEGVSIQAPTLSDASIRLVAKLRGHVMLHGVKAVTDEQANLLAALPGHLDMFGLESLTSLPLAEKLVGPQPGGRISMPTVQRVSPEVAALLARQGTETLELRALEADADVLATLAAASGHLTLGNKSLGPKEVEALMAARCRSLTLSAADLTPEAVRQMDGLPVVLHLPAVRKLSDETIAALAAGRLRVMLPSLDVPALPVKAFERIVDNERIDGQFFGAITRLTVPMAAAIARRTGSVTLAGLGSIDTPDAVEIAAALAAKEGGLVLPTLKRLSVKTLAALLEKEDVQIPPVAELDLIAEPDGSANDDFVLPAKVLERQRSPQGR